MNKRISLSFIGMALLSITFALHAQEPTSSDIALNQLVNKLKKINTFSANFIQYAVDQKGTRIQESRGELKAERSGLFYWQTFEPLQQIVVSDGKEVTVYDPDLEQATIQSVGQQAQTTPAILFSGDTAKIGESFNVELKAETKESQQFLLTPRTGESLFERLLVRFVGDTVQELRIYDALGQESTMSFIDTKVNQAFNAKTFKLKLPKGTDIIRDLPVK